MADQVQWRRGSTSQNLAFTGAQGEIIVDTTKNALVVHDGITPGGFPQATSSQVTNGTRYYNEDVGSAANAYILTPKANTLSPSAYQDGIMFGFVTANANTGASTANFQGLGVKNLKYSDGTDPLPGDISGRVNLIYNAANDWLEIQRKALGPPPQLRTIGAAVSSNSLMFTLQPCVIDFRAASLGSGTITTKNITSAISLTVPAGATLGTVSATAGRLVLLAISAPVGIELAVVNLSGGVNLDETTLINTVAITSGSSSKSVIYSTTARTGVPFRVVGFIDSTQTTAGSWAAVPSTIQGAGGQAIAALASFGFGQTWQDVTASRALGTTYTNTTGKPILISVAATSTAAAALPISVDGVIVANGNAQSAIGATAWNTTVVPPGSTYSAVINSGTGTLTRWMELR